jgi:phosphohistidine swiveling domain-containing protein
VRPETVWSHGKAHLTAVYLEKASDETRIFQGGITGCPGVVSGVLRVVKNIAEAEAVLQTGDILVTPNTTNIWELVFSRINGIITDIGGTGSHTDVVMREIGKPALVGAGHAMQSLKAYENSLITLDATQRMIFAGAEASEITRQLKTITPAYGAADFQTEGESWTETSTLPGRTSIDSARRRWINKPDYPVCKFMQSVYLEAHQWIGRRLQTLVRNEIDQSIHRIAFEDLFQSRIRLRQMGIDDLEKLHDEREKAFADYLEAIMNFALKHEAVNNWLMLYVKVNVFIGLGFDIYKVLEEMLDDALANKKIAEPYYTQIRSSRQEIGDFESTCAARDLFSLIAEARNHRCQTEALETACASQDDEPTKTNDHEPFYKRLEHYANNYKVTCVAEINQSTTEVVLAVVREILNIIGGCRAISHKSNMFPSEKDVQFFPYDLYLQRVLRLALSSEKARQDSHDLRVRGHWLIRENLEQLSHFLIKKQKIKCFSEIFYHSPEWLLEQVWESEDSSL